MTGDDLATLAESWLLQLALKRFSACLADEDETDRDDLLGLKPPKLDAKVVESLTDDQVAAMVKACAGRDARGGTPNNSGRNTHTPGDPDNQRLPR